MSIGANIHEAQYAHEKPDIKAAFLKIRKNGRISPAACKLISDFQHRQRGQTDRRPHPVVLRRRIICPGVPGSPWRALPEVRADDPGPPSVPTPHHAT